MSNEVAVVASSRLSSLEATPPMHVDRDRSAPGTRNTWRHPTHWFLLLLLPETQTVFDVTEKLMFSARGLCLSSPKAGRSKGEGPPGSRKVEGEVTEKKNQCLQGPWAERNYFGKKRKTVCLEYRVRCVDWERAGQSGQRPSGGSHKRWGRFCQRVGISWLLPFCTVKSFDAFLDFSSILSSFIDGHACLKTG